MRGARGPQTIQVVAIFICPPELDDKTLLLKISDALDARNREIKLVLSQELPLGWVAFTPPTS